MRAFICARTSSSIWAMKSAPHRVNLCARNSGAIERANILICFLFNSVIFPVVAGRIPARRWRCSGQVVRAPPRASCAQLCGLVFWLSAPRHLARRCTFSWLSILSFFWVLIVEKLPGITPPPRPGIPPPIPLRFPGGGRCPTNAAKSLCRGFRLGW